MEQFLDTPSSEKTCSGSIKPYENEVVTDKLAKVIESLRRLLPIPIAKSDCTIEIKSGNYYYLQNEYIQRRLEKSRYLKKLALKILRAVVTPKDIQKFKELCLYKLYTIKINGLEVNYHTLGTGTDGSFYVYLNSDIYFSINGGEKKRNCRIKAGDEINIEGEIFSIQMPNFQNEYIDIFDTCDRISAMLEPRYLDVSESSPEIESKNEILKRWFTKEYISDWIKDGKPLLWSIVVDIQKFSDALYSSAQGNNLYNFKQAINKSISDFEEIAHLLGVRADVIDFRSTFLGDGASLSFRLKDYCELIQETISEAICINPLDFRSKVETTMYHDIIDITFPDGIDIESVITAPDILADENINSDSDSLSSVIKKIRTNLYSQTITHQYDLTFIKICGQNLRLRYNSYQKAQDFMTLYNDPEIALLGISVKKRPHILCIDLINNNIPQDLRSRAISNLSQLPFIGLGGIVYTENTIEITLDQVRDGQKIYTLLQNMSSVFNQAISKLDLVGRTGVSAIPYLPDIPDYLLRNLGHIQADTIQHTAEVGGLVFPLSFTRDIFFWLNEADAQRIEMMQQAPTVTGLEKEPSLVPAAGHLKPLTLFDIFTVQWLKINPHFRKYHRQLQVLKMDKNRSV